MAMNRGMVSPTHRSADNLVPIERRLPKWMPSTVLFVALFSWLITRVGPLSSQSYLGTQMIPHPHPVDVRVGNTSYAIILDGGSTGSRIHIFSFNSYIDKKSRTRRIYLEKELFHHTTPGLSSFADQPHQAVDSLKPLIAKALEQVPASMAGQTSVMLKATAGLRLLPQQTADLILDTVRQFLLTTPFKVDDDAVSMLDDRDEGIFAWYTINFLLGKLHNISSSIVTLDLGGGSTQITFATNHIETLVKSPSNFIVKRDIEGEPEYLYTHSYLGFGLMSARKRILLSDQTFFVDDNRVKVTNPCFAMLGNASETWTFQDTTFAISGQKSNGAFERCYQLARDLVSEAIQKPEELKHRKIYAMSYYFDRLADVKVIRQKDGVGVVKLKDYLLTAEHVCNSVIKMKKKNPFLCLDLTYNAALLHDGYGIDWNQDITFIKKINGIETSWALGAAINLLNFNKNF